jgi:hypothetical protein
VYGEKVPDEEFNNLRNKLYLHLDQAGVLISTSYDFKAICSWLRASWRENTDNQPIGQQSTLLCQPTPVLS